MTENREIWRLDVGENTIERRKGTSYKGGSILTFQW